MKPVHAAVALALCLTPTLAWADDPPVPPPDPPPPVDTTSPDSPDYQAPPPPDYSDWNAEQIGLKRHSKSMMIGGAVVAGLGALGFLAGLVDYLAAETFCTSLSSQGFERGSCVDTYHIIGAAGMVTGGVMLAVGIPLVVVGSRKGQPKGTLAVPDVRIGVGQASLRWEF